MRNQTQKNTGIEPLASKTSRALEAVGLHDSRTREASLGKRAAALGLVAASFLAVGRAAEQQVHSDNPLGVKAPTDQGSGVTETVPIVGQEQLPEEPSATVVIAKPGDTLWTIARDTLGPDEDIRQEVDAMLAKRGSADLQPGDEVEVPLDR